MIAILIALMVVGGALYGAEAVLSRMPRVDAALDRFIGGKDAPVEALPADAWARKHGYTD